MITGLLMTFFGYSVIHRFFRETFLKKMALGFLLGFGMTTVPLFLLTYFHIRLNQNVVISLLAALTFLSLFLLMKTGQQIKKRDKIAKLSKKLSTIQRIVILLILTTVFVSFFINWYWPVTAWDAVTLYDFRAKLYANGGLLSDLWPNIDYSVSKLSYYYSYPPLTSLAHTISYLISDNHISVLYSFFYVSLISLFFSQVYKKTSLSTSLVLTFLLATNFTIFTHSLLSYTNVPYAVYLVAAFFILEEFADTKKTGYFILGTLFSCLTLLIRNVEPFPFLLALIFIPLIFKKRSYLKHLGIFVFINLAVQFLAFNQIKSDLAFFNGSVIENEAAVPSFGAIIMSIFYLQKYPEVFSYLYQAMQKYHMYLLLFIVSLGLSRKRVLYGNLVLSSFIVLASVALIPGTLILSVTYEGWNRVPDSVNRLMFFLYPLILYYLSAIPEVRTLLDYFANKQEFKRK